MAEQSSSAQPFSGRVALVTGASRGIGHALALELARAGAHVIALARTQGALEDLDDAIRAAGSEATLVPCDLTDFDALDRLGAAIHERWKKLDIFRRQCGRTRRRYAAPAYRSKRLGQSHRRQCHRELAADSRARSAAAGGRGRTGSFHYVRHRAPHRLSPLLGRLCGLQSCARCLGADLCGGNRDDLKRKSHAGQSGAAAYADARQGHAGRRPVDAQDTRGFCAKASAVPAAVIDANRPTLRFSER